MPIERFQHPAFQTMPLPGFTWPRGEPAIAKEEKITRLTRQAGDLQQKLTESETAREQVTAESMSLAEQNKLMLGKINELVSIINIMGERILLIEQALSRKR